MADTPRLVLALDDTPTKRHGPEVQGAGVHHNPTPGPAGGPFVYGHVWVVLGLLVTRPLGGLVALPLLARLYIRDKNLGAIGVKSRPAFATKLEMAVELVRWAHGWRSVAKPRAGGTRTRRSEARGVPSHGRPDVPADIPCEFGAGMNFISRNNRFRRPATAAPLHHKGPSEGRRAATGLPGALKEGSRRSGTRTGLRG